MKLIRKLTAALALLALASGAALAASIPLYTPPSGNNALPTFPENTGDFNNLVNAINGNITPQSMASFSAFRNYIDNGGMFVVQRGAATSSTAAGGTSGCTALTYVADRWCVDVNVGSQVGKGQVVTSTPTPPTGFTNVMTVWRNANALTQPHCAIQEISSQRITQLQGQTVTLSFFAQALAGLSADNGNVINATFVTGTTADQGLGSMTASPAITPAFSGLATQLNAQAFTLSASAWNRFTATSFQIPTNALEGAVELCFTPTATGSGATDGFAFVGVQLEPGNAPSAFEFRDYQAELAEAQRYYWEFDEKVSGTTVVPGICNAQSATVATCNIPLKVTQRAAAPAIACTFGTMKRMIAGTDTALTACAAAATTNGVGTPDAAEITATVGSGDTAGFASVLMSGNSTGGGLITVSSDF